ncbi:LPXTG cell wall anchor domain-containing protein, partial [Enterococcus faecium]
NTPSKQVLPNTGESSNVWMVISGIIGLVVAGLGYFFHKRNA